MPKNDTDALRHIDVITMENKSNIHRMVTQLIEKGAERFSFVGDIYSSNVGRGFQERYEALLECWMRKHLELDAKCCLLMIRPRTSGISNSW